MSPLLRLVFTFTLALPTIALVGCGGGPRLDGTVTLDGQPVDGGSIALIPAGGSGANVTGEIKDGKYSLDSTRGLTAGSYRVEINWLKPTGKKLPNSNDPGTTVDETKQVIPLNYNKNTELKIDVKSGSQTQDFALKSGGPVDGGPSGGNKVKAVGD